MHHPTDRIAHTTAFVTTVVEHWLERDTTMKVVIFVVLFISNTCSCLEAVESGNIFLISLLLMETAFSHVTND